MQNYLLSIFPDQRDASLSSPAPATATGVYIDLHSYSQLVLWPWGFTTSVAPNSAALQTLGRKFAYFNSYTPEQAVSLYATDGTTDDFAYGNLGVAAYTFEMGTAFFQACSTFESTIYPTNLNALIYAAKVVRTPITQHVVNHRDALHLRRDHVSPVCALNVSSARRLRRLLREHRRPRPATRAGRRLRPTRL